MKNFEPYAYVCDSQLKHTSSNLYSKCLFILNENDKVSFLLLFNTQYSLKDLIKSIIT